MKEHQKRGVIRHAALKANTHRETAARYLRRQLGPNELKHRRPARNYRTRVDPLLDVWPAALRYLEADAEEAQGVRLTVPRRRPSPATGSVCSGESIHSDLIFVGDN